MQMQEVKTFEQIKEEVKAFTEKLIQSGVELELIEHALFFASKDIRASGGKLAVNDQRTAPSNQHATN